MPAAAPPRLPLATAAGLLGTCALLVIGAAALLQPLPPAAPRRSGPAAGAQTTGPCGLGADAFLRGRLFGALDLAVDWAGAGLACSGMLRPDGAGIRLFFAGTPPGGGRVSVIIGVDGAPEALTGGERPANVTIIDERDSRFFSTGGPGRCWANIGTLAPLPATKGRPKGLRLDGLVYCVGALPSLTDRSSLTFRELRFAGSVATE
jgi:hypothetical protein